MPTPPGERSPGRRRAPEGRSSTAILRPISAPRWGDSWSGTGFPPLADGSLSPEEKLAAVERFRILSPTHRGRLWRRGDQPGGRPDPGRQRDPGREHLVSGALRHRRQKRLRPRHLQRRHRPRPAPAEMADSKSASTRRRVTARSAPPASRRWTAPGRSPSTAPRVASTTTSCSSCRHRRTRRSSAANSSTTGLSRAKSSATIWCDEATFRTTIATTVKRASGLASMFVGGA